MYVHLKCVNNGNWCNDMSVSVDVSLLRTAPCYAVVSCCTQGLANLAAGVNDVSGNKLPATYLQIVPDQTSMSRRQVPSSQLILKRQF